MPCYSEGYFCLVFFLGGEGVETFSSVIKFRLFFYKKVPCLSGFVDTNEKSFMSFATEIRTASQT